MKLTILSLIVALSMFQTASAYYGYYGYGYGYPYSYGYGYPLNIAYGIYGKRASGETPAIKVEKTECFYQKETSMLTCFGKYEKQECEATFKMDDKMTYEYFGIGEYKGEASGDKKFALIPRKSDNTAWLDDYFTVDGKKSYFSMYQSSKLNDYGLKVKSAECFDKIFEILNKSTRHEKVYIQSVTGENAEIYLIADVAIQDEMPEEEVEKRQYSSYRYPYGLYKYGRYNYGRYNRYNYGRYNYGRYNYGYNRYNRYFRYGRDADMEEPEFSERDFEDSDIEKDLMKSLRASDDYMERMAGEIEKIKRDIDMIKLDSHEPEVRTRRSSMWTKQY